MEINVIKLIFFLIVSEILPYTDVGQPCILKAYMSAIHRKKSTDCNSSKIRT